MLKTLYYNFYPMWERRTAEEFLETFKTFCEKIGPLKEVFVDGFDDSRVIVGFTREETPEEISKREEQARKAKESRLNLYQTLKKEFGQ